MKKGKGFTGFLIILGAVIVLIIIVALVTGDKTEEVIIPETVENSVEEIENFEYEVIEGKDKG